MKKSCKYGEYPTLEHFLFFSVLLCFGFLFCFVLFFLPVLH